MSITDFQKGDRVRMTKDKDIMLEFRGQAGTVRNVDRRTVWIDFDDPNLYLANAEPRYLEHETKWATGLTQ